MRNAFNYSLRQNVLYLISYLKKTIYSCRLVLLLNVIHIRDFRNENLKYIVTFSELISRIQFVYKELKIPQSMFIFNFNEQNYLAIAKILITKRTYNEQIAAYLIELCINFFLHTSD